MSGHPSLLGGWHRPPRSASAKPGLHAVSPGADRNGARRAACGIIGRFLPLEGWEPFPLAGDSRCEKCTNAITLSSEVDKVMAYK